MSICCCCKTNVEAASIIGKSLMILSLFSCILQSFLTTYVVRILWRSRQEVVNQNLPGKLGQQSTICWNSLCLFRDYSLNYIFLGIFFLFFKIESWNFQHLFEKEFRETSQNINSFRQFLFPFSLSIVWLSEVSQNSFSNRRWKFQLSVLKNKSFIPEKYII